MMKEFLISKKGIFCINLVLLILFAFSGCMKYEVSDDFIMEMVVSGAYTGSPSSFIMFMHPMIGIVLLYVIYIYRNNQLVFYFSNCGNIYFIMHYIVYVFEI